MFVKLTQKCDSFGRWMAMALENGDRLRQHGGTIVFAGTEKDDDTNMFAIIHYESMEGLKSFKEDKEFAEIRAAAGAHVETTAVTFLNENPLVNHPSSIKNP
jgi:uncharacterized protein (DUF1330 family)